MMTQWPLQCNAMSRRYMGTNLEPVLSSSKDRSARPKGGDKQ